MTKNNNKISPPALLNHPASKKGRGPACGEGVPFLMSGRHYITVSPTVILTDYSLKTTSPRSLILRQGRPIAISKWTTSEAINGGSPLSSKHLLFSFSHALIRCDSSSFKRTVLIIFVVSFDMRVFTLYTCCIL